MGFVVLTRFADLQDGNRIYEAGDNYPRPGFNVSDERIAELAGSDNRMGYPLIKAAEPPKNTATDEPKEIPTETARTRKTPRRVKKSG